METAAFAHSTGDKIHDGGTCEERDDAAECRQRDGEGHVAPCQHGENVAGTAPRATGDEHDAEEEERWQMKQVANTPCDEWQEDDLSQ